MIKIFKDQKILITGGTGSFGQAVVERFLSTEVSEIRIFSRDEKKQEDMRLKFQNSKIKFYIGDVRDPSSLRVAMQDVDFVFHAAALKQVPSCEFYPMEALKTNVMGTEHVLACANEAAVKKVIVLSTDKAVYPINAMGMTKALAEKVMIAASRAQKKNSTIFCATRYGNVMVSRGSVIPLFIEQLKRGNPVTVTDPNMTRFMMSLEESVELVLFAFQHGDQGDIFVQKSPASTVGDLVTSLAQIFGTDKSTVKIIGTRHGEKLYESLLSKEEVLRSEDQGLYFRIPADGRDLNYAKYFSEGSNDVSSVEAYTSHNARRLNVEEITEMLLQLEYVRSEKNC
jgi:UDP-N-acetylglucosamine 4,6-dehydratase